MGWAAGSITHVRTGPCQARALSVQAQGICSPGPALRLLQVKTFKMSRKAPFSELQKRVHEEMGVSALGSNCAHFPCNA